MKGKPKKDLERTAKELTKGDRFNMHVSVINREEAKEELGLNVEFWNQNDVRW